MRKLFPTLALMLFMLLQSMPFDAKAARRAENLLTPGQIIALINAYRAENGLPAYTQNSILMQTAQGQADYQASIESVTHAGPDGSRPRDRAYAAGYGGGEVVFISEIIYGATASGPEAAVSWWKTSQIHNDTMLASTYQEIGAGVASANGRNYYTAVTGYVAGGVYVPPGGNTASENSEPLVAAPVIIPVVRATPQENGSITHIIRTGQTLWTLSAVYEVPLAMILQLNNLPENAVVFPGDEIIIAKNVSPIATPTPEAESVTATSTPISPTATRLAATATATQRAVALAADQQESNEEKSTNPNAGVRFTISLALAFIAIVVLATFFIRSPRSLTEQDSSQFDQ